MGNTQIKPQSFGSVNPSEGEKGRPGYFITKFGVKYQGKEIIPLPGENTFKKLNYGYAASNLRVFYNGKAIPDADPKTFTIVPRKKEEKLKHLNCVLGKDVKSGKIRWYKFGNVIHEEL
jgi:hypothetical protein